MIFENIPPYVSIPNDNGVTSSITKSSTFPVNIPPYIDAPTATASSGLRDLFGFRPKNS